MKLILSTASILFACALAAQTPVPPNTLTKQELADGWKLLFDGKTFNGWRGFHRDAMPPAGWVVENGTIKTMPAPNGEGGDIITTEEFSNFALSLEWKVRSEEHSLNSSHRT